MKIVHWSLKNGSGLHRMAEELSTYEESIGLTSLCLDGDKPLDIQFGYNADINVIHGHIPDVLDAPGVKTIFVAHGTPETCFASSINDSTAGHGASDALMQSLYRIKSSDAVVTFWPRHQFVWQAMMDKGRVVDCIPMGIDTSKWQRQESKGKWAGSPSLLTAENCHQIKWPLDLFIAIPSVMEQMREMRLHCFNLPMDQVRWWSVLSIGNGAAYRSFMESASMSQEALLNAFCSVDYYIGLVRYGDFNRNCLEAKTAGCPVISYRGNGYADFWVDEGDQRIIADQLLDILKGNVEKRESLTPPDVSEMAAAMAKIYERIA